MASRLAGITQATRATYKLKKIYNRILLLTERFPKDSCYRINTEAIICHRLSVVNQSENVKHIEETICCGCIEMLILQALKELELCQSMIIWKPWEPLIQQPPPGQWKWPPIIK